jgi:hypothetical protein
MIRLPSSSRISPILDLGSFQIVGEQVGGAQPALLA